MTHRALMTHLAVLMIAAFLLLGNASLSAVHKPFHPKPLPNQAASAVLSVFRYDAKALAEARKIAKPTLNDVMASYDR